MQAAGLGVEDLAFGSNMLWDCSLAINVRGSVPRVFVSTDVLYELKNLAVKYVKRRCYEFALF